MVSMKVSFYQKQRIQQGILSPLIRKTNDIHYNASLHIGAILRLGWVC